ncbi:MAG: NADH-quinone oxidoreductase subunit J [Chlorobiota bacterium]|nr:NADH-quinone oxidoreductase subunit J [Chlorobiota bacterium]QQS65786.1 MAG: NADH-quinone oxidoreductase subunit J [Chlorobiota bacterium]
MYDFIFIVFAIITVGSSLFVAFAKSIAHAAFALVATLFGVAGLFVMLGADFVGVSQLLVYVGGILILFLFGMMLTSNIDKLGEDKPSTGKLLPGSIASSAIGGMLLAIIWSNPVWTKATVKQIPAGMNTTSILGAMYLKDFLPIFLGVSIAMLIALVGAAMIARSDK